MTLEVVQKEPYDALMRRLREVGEARPYLRAATNTLVAPVELLRAMAANTPAAMASDAFAIERLRLLLAAAPDPDDPRGRASDRTRSRSTSTSRTSKRRAASGNEDRVGHYAAALNRVVDAPACNPALLRHGPLVVVGLAAVRVGAEVDHTSIFLHRVLWTAMRAAPASAVARLAVEEQAGEALVAFLEQMAADDASTSDFEFLSRVVLGDPRELGSINCLTRLFNVTLRETDEQGTVPWPVSAEMDTWYGASSRAITAVVPRDASVGAAVTLRGALKPDGELKATFAAPGRPMGLVAALDNYGDGKGVTTVVPEGAEPGWVGLFTEATLQEANAFRAALAEHWSQYELQCATGSQVPVDIIMQLPAVPIPPRTERNLFDGGLPRIDRLTVTPQRAEVGETVSVTWRSSGADNVLLTFGNDEPLTLPADSSMEHTVTAETVTGDGDAAALHVGAVGQRTPDGSNTPVIGNPETATIAVTLPETTPPPPPIQIVLIRPYALRDGLSKVLGQADKGASVTDAVPRATYDATVAKIAQALGVSFMTRELPWTPDPLAVLPRLPHSLEDPLLDELHARMGRAAMSTPGLEAAVWVMLMPGTAAVADQTDAEAAVATAVATAAGLPDLLHTLVARLWDGAAMQPSVPRVRILGKRVGNDRVALAEVRHEVRAAGPGTEAGVGLVAVVLDDAGLRYTRPCFSVARMDCS